MKDASGSTVAEHMRTPNWHQQRNSVFPMPAVVMSGLALLAALILAFARATLTAKGHLHIAARLDAHVHTAMFLGGVGMFTATSIAIARLVGTRVLESPLIDGEWLRRYQAAPLPASTMLYRRASSSPSPRAEPSSPSSAQ